MGIFNFIKEAGEELFGGDKAEAATPDQVKSQLAKHNFNTDGIDVKVEGDKIVLGGKADSQELAERMALALGNTKGIAQVESNLEVPAGQKESKMYTVKAGDTLSKISEEVYGDANKYNDIFEANKPMLSSADKIYPGQVLRIPENVA
ncbi:peptidoglycan-binding protein LysM [Taylorella equigenitalis]|uniref:Potassium binding protein Kbp n=3 Tax=Taylorella equigenitalis TaxID=29575 RepID=A0A654KHB7_TAYEM|nr:peptidoglycan-binding protein LysM [Taylorella equigenitalis]ADU91858.1 hypothetical protein TEQUI_0927 [Taylorella equigenitalis MCE9]AFN35423.1 putative peptidoglycan binding protein [Taylorella equigenitalis ATCC 35865]ASY30080.1 peptidoglycan-binding protein LysM [Taylorella equigenitalis]ASY37385.1 peptidoglycan-binding protein LysM [Taylorella equigenitalis]ASY38851.1 peptidoglycan-binding protein LysM [Taylorella equigenitalis]